MHRRTKMICTIGPAVASFEKMLALIDAGMNVARLNFSHGAHADHQKSIDNLKKAREIKGLPLAIMLDTKGPEVRIGKMPEGGVELKAGQKVKLVKDGQGSEKQLPLLPAHIVDDLDVGVVVLIDDGYIASKVVEKAADHVVIQIENDGVVSSSKGVNIPHVDLSLPSLTEQDIADITFGADNGIDLIAASFVRTADDVLAIKSLLRNLGKSEILVIAKIESAMGVSNFDSILQVADGIMVARGDLGVEVPLTTVPMLQKMMIKKCYSSAKACITATQMLESMIHNPRPTRAEVSDVANAIYDSTSAVMLSGETAIGKYPIESAQMMHSIVVQAEHDFDYESFFTHDIHHEFNDISSSVALAAVKTSYSADAKALFTFTSSGYTARVMSRFRPRSPIIALTSNAKTYQQLAVNWGVVPALTKESKDVKDAFVHASCFAISHNKAEYGDLVVVTAGSSFGITGTTNTMIVRHIGDVLVRGHTGQGERIYGSIAIVLAKEEAVDTQGKIAVITCCESSTLEKLKGVKGIVLQNSIDDDGSKRRLEQFASENKVSYITRADGATSLLEDGQSVTLDPARGLVFKGSIPSDDEIVARVCQRT
ncbi:MAG: pyruvate kinase [Chlamydiales bacterium]|nr:pyruvate kinase [Chlamydiales bacterium]